MKLSNLLSFLSLTIVSPYTCYGSILPLQEVVSSPAPNSPEYSVNSSPAPEFRTDTLAGANSSFTGYKGPGVYLIKNLQSGTYVDLWGGSKTDGAKMAGWEYNGLDNQKWHIVEAEGNTVILINNGTGTLAAATARNAVIQGRVLPPHSLYARWKMDDQAYRSYDGYPTRFVNQGTCQPLQVSSGEPHGLLYTWEPHPGPYEAFYLQLVEETRIPCSGCA